MIKPCRNKGIETVVRFKRHSQHAVNEERDRLKNQSTTYQTKIFRNDCENHVTLTNWTFNSR